MRLWGGRFESDPDDVVWSFTVDRSDRRLLVDDIDGSLAHVAMLAATGILTGEEAAEIEDGLGQIRREAETGDFAWADGDEDVHSAVERRLHELVGEVAGKLHTARSRNDQVALDTRLYLRRSAATRRRDLAAFIEVLIAKAEEVGETIVPSYTHLQQAQPVPLAHHFLAYAWMLLRDRERFAAVEARLAESPLGAGAGGGSSLPVDPAAAARNLGMAGVFANSLDAVASRDLVAEYVFCCSQAMTHLSRLAEEAVMWATSEFAWVTYDDALTTGSSALPHKKNPDVAELVRGRAAAVIGDVAAILALQKALPLAYNRDLQEDKRIVFHADDTLAGSLDALGALFSSAEFAPPRPGGWLGALDVAEALVARGVPFREAHHLVGRLVRTLVAEDRDLSDAEPGDLLAIDPRFDAEDLSVADPATSVQRRTSPGGGSFASVATQIEELRRHLA